MTAPTRGRWEPWYRLGKIVLRPQVRLWFNWRFEGIEHIPRSGPAIIASNHLSYFDPIALSYPLIDTLDRWPRFLAKAELFRVPLLSSVLRSAGQIPVERGTGSTAPLDAAAEELREGQVVAVYPEGTTTKDTEFWPQTFKTGVARLALAAGLPVYPAAIWGSHRVWKSKRDLVPAFGRPIWISIGEPLVLDGEEDDQSALREGTDRIQVEVRLLLEEIRRHYPERWR